MPDSGDTPDIVSDHMAWAAATAGPGWPEKYEGPTAACKQRRWFSLVIEREEAEAWAAQPARRAPEKARDEEAEA